MTASTRMPSSSLFDRAADKQSGSARFQTRFSTRPIYLMRGDVPARALADNERGLLRRTAIRLAAPFRMRPYPFEEAYFLGQARQFLSELDLPLILLGGLNRLETLEAALPEGFAFVAMGRALIRQPDLVRRMQRGQAEGLCVHCNLCVVEMERGGTRCVLRIPEKAALL